MEAGCSCILLLFILAVSCFLVALSCSLLLRLACFLVRYVYLTVKVLFCHKKALEFHGGLSAILLHIGRFYDKNPMNYMDCGGNAVYSLGSNQQYLKDNEELCYESGTEGSEAAVSLELEYSEPGALEDEMARSEDFEFSHKCRPGSRQGLVNYTENYCTESYQSCHSEISENPNACNIMPLHLSAAQDKESDGLELDDTVCSHLVIFPETSNEISPDRALMQFEFEFSTVSFNNESNGQAIFNTGKPDSVGVFEDSQADLQWKDTCQTDLTTLHASSRAFQGLDFEFPALGISGNTIANMEWVDNSGDLFALDRFAGAEIQCSVLRNPNTKKIVSSLVHRNAGSGRTRVSQADDRMSRDYATTVKPTIPHESLQLYENETFVMCEDLLRGSSTRRRLQALEHINSLPLSTTVAEGHEHLRDTQISVFDELMDFWRRKERDAAVFSKPHSSNGQKPSKYPKDLRNETLTCPLFFCRSEAK
eukprot:Gb_29905 [translate_table: standard]